MNQGVQEILKELKPEIDKMEHSIVDSIENHPKQPKKVGAWSREMIRLGIIYDLVRSLERNILPTDTYSKLTSRSSKKGNLEVSMMVNRDGIEYPYYTEAIFAGGYNIQVLHFRYITKTKLPKVAGNDIIAKQVKAKIQKMNKGQKLKQEIEYLENQVEEYKKHAIDSSKLSDAKILGMLKQDYTYRHLFTRYDDIPANAPIKDKSKPYYQDKKAFEDEQKLDIIKAIEGWKRKNIHMKKVYMADFQKTIKRLQTKLDALAL